jgi:hypothetical protein
LSDPSIHLPLTSSPLFALLLSDPNTQSLPSCFHSEGGTPKNFRQTIHTNLQPEFVSYSRKQTGISNHALY